jgi:hypothetical protein
VNHDNGKAIGVSALFPSDGVKGRYLQHAFVVRFNGRIKDISEGGGGVKHEPSKENACIFLSP